MAIKQAGQILSEIKIYGGRMKAKFYDCIWTSSNGNSQSGNFPEFVMSHVM